MRVFHLNVLYLIIAMTSDACSNEASSSSTIVNIHGDLYFCGSTPISGAGS